ncbi:MAG: hypothetical protein HYX93_00905 [Chloroflexi bacterium]|nr:hypothetical protein [Chloroflexota bacterium]
MKLKVFDHETLIRLDDSSKRAGRAQNLRQEQLSTAPQGRHWVNAHLERVGAGQQEVRMCVVLDLNAGKTAWLDVSPQEFAAIPEVEVPYLEWTAAMCAGNPPPAP